MTAIRRALRVLVTAGLVVSTGVALAPAAAAKTTSIAAITVTGDGTATPVIQFSAPFAVTKSVNRVMTAGTGDRLGKSDRVALDYLMVDGRTGKQVQTSYGDKEVSLVLDTKVTAAPLVNALKGRTVGSRVLVALAPKDGVVKTVASNKNGVKKDDTLLMLLDVHYLHPQLSRATGTAVVPPAGLPKVTLAATGKPTITLPGGAAPTTLVVQRLIVGAGRPVVSGQNVHVQYTGVIWASGKQFDSSWDRGTPADFVIGKGQVIAGWDEGLVGQTVGSQVLLVVPPDKGYGTQGQSSAGIKGTDTLVFVVDILDAY